VVSRNKKIDNNQLQRRSIMKALILVDLQNDFMPGGALAVEEGNEVVAIANYLAPRFDLVVATQDWHPANHASFASTHQGRKPGDQVELNGVTQTLWPDHCVQGTPGADFHANLHRNSIDRIFHKGTNPEIDSYSGFYDNNRQFSTGMTDWLRKQGVEQVYIMGLATDYCVKFTALDAIKEGFRTFLITDGCRGVNLNSGDVALALSQMSETGVNLISSREIEIAASA